MAAKRASPKQLNRRLAVTTPQFGQTKTNEEHLFPNLKTCRVAKATMFWTTAIWIWYAPLCPKITNANHAQACRLLILNAKKMSYLTLTKSTVRGLSTTTKNNWLGNQQLSRLKQDSFRPMMTARLEMIITLLNMQLQQTSRNATPAEENLTQKQWKSTKRFAKKFS